MTADELLDMIRRLTHRQARGDLEAIGDGVFVSPGCPSLTLVIEDGDAITTGTPLEITVRPALVELPAVRRLREGGAK